jgi:hypothetical protein
MGDDLVRYSTSLCAFNACSWSEYSARIGCGGGSGDCADATFLKVKESSFHPPDLVAATEQIIKALEGLKPPEGMKLAILETPFGNVLAYVEPDAKFPQEETVTVKSSQREIIEALGIIDVKPDDEGYSAA